ncbi:short chain dehydrogenase/reductase, putative [Talaromyces stipitatus ATCC 10500]|uniref:Short chain dehydrogenase/reductase, putative n=1 Tax=Talaromyces stipitatus (strain ATCC 10500 / CBS 375.48 / QM 6759 / NRRL 1006) TaxID=441959 RepID=B8M5S5_TALSN|nr:short chain dehydrogenase/reductase, putative [Talaromyces stipitatus ATCC 10500]EED20052.1 short chain dehydrogenase/reductase, putative [Talaromyces stipitatus ATCC 10500]
MTAKQIITLITGANQGLGFEVAKNLVLSSGSYHVIIGSRDPSKGAKAVANLQSLPDIKGTLDTLEIEVTDDESVDTAAEAVAAKHGRLDVLVNNAGILGQLPSLRDSLRAVLNVNVIGAASVTEAFLPLLRKSEEPRLIFVGSSIGSITGASDPSSPYYRPQGTDYRVSKAALNMLMVQYHHILGLEKKNFKVFTADPGLNATNFTGDADSLRARGAAEPHVGGAVIADVVKGVRDADVGKMVGKYGVSPW